MLRKIRQVRQGLLHAWFPLHVFSLTLLICNQLQYLHLPEKIADIVKGVAEGCKQSGAALIGGETAEMPGFYPEDEYDLAGFSFT